MVAICIKYCYVLLINLYYIPDPPFLLHAILETALTHLRLLCIYSVLIGGLWTTSTYLVLECFMTERPAKNNYVSGVIYQCCFIDMSDQCRGPDVHNLQP